MNKKYIDFVPAKRNRVKPARPAPSPNTEVRHEKYVARVDVGDEVLDLKADTFSIKSESRLGVVEDVDTKFVKTDVPKRPLSKEPQAHSGSYTVPKSPFINQANVTKRPLSKHVYTKKIEPVEEKKQGPVKIIEKPKKDSKIGLVITIILTIILGAAAGTVAFLLLPK